MSFLTVALLSLPFALQDDAKTRVTCECGTWLEAKAGNLVLGHKETTIASTPIYRGQALLRGKTLNMAKKNKLTCLCKKKVTVPAWFTVPSGSFRCSNCPGEWVIKGSSLEAYVKGRRLVSFPIRGGIVQPTDTWKKSLGEEVDLMKARTLGCPCGGSMTIREGAAPDPGGMPPKKKTKSGKKLGAVKCECGGSLTVRENMVTVLFKKNKVMNVVVKDSKVKLLGKVIDLKEENKVTCACGAEVTIPALASGK